MAARHRATTSSASPSFSKAAAASLKNFAVSSGTPLQATADVLAAARRADSIEGGPDRSNLKPCPRSLSMRTISRCCLLPNNRTETPFLPARPVLPERWTYVSTSRGGSN